MKLTVCYALLIAAGLFLNLTFCAENAYSQNNDTTRLVQGYLNSYLFDSRDVLLFPKEIKKKDFDFIGASALAISSGFMFDERIEEYLRKNDLHSKNDKTTDLLFSNWGNGIYPAATALILYGLGAKNQRDDLRWLSLLQVKTLCISAVTSRVPKYLFQRKRPDENGPVDAWTWYGPFKGLTGNYSFPSGHTFIVFSWAAVTASAFKENKGLVIGLYALASLVGVSRIYKGDHWTSDVLAGAALGYATGKISYRIQERNWKKKKVKSF